MTGGNMKRNRKSIYVAILLVAILIAGFMIYNGDVVSYSLKPAPSYMFPLNTSMENTFAHENLKIGYINTTAHGCTATYEYAFLPTGGVTKLYFNGTQNVFHLVNIFQIVLINKTVSKPYTDMTFRVDLISIASPQGIAGGVKMSPSIDGSGYSWAGNVHTAPTSGDIYSALSGYPGFHNMYFNFTLTPFAQYGPLKISGKSVHISIEWNITVFG